MKNYFKVYHNGRLVAETGSASLRECKRFIKNGPIVIGTHMGEWRRMPTGYAYLTTTGAIIDFVRFGKESS